MSTTKYFMGFEITLTPRRVGSTPCGYKATFLNDTRVFTVFGGSFNDTLNEATEWINRIMKGLVK